MSRSQPLSSSRQLFKRLSDLIALSTGNINIVTSRWPPKVRERIFIFKGKLDSELSPETLDLDLHLSTENV